MTRRRAGRRGRPPLTAGLVAALLVVGCHDGHPEADAEPVGWHTVSAPPEVLPWGGTLWVADELAFFSVIGGSSWAYVPSRDQWKSIASPPRTDSPAGWTMVSTDSQIVAVSQAATAVYEPKADRWRSLPPAPQPQEFIEPQKWTPSLVWTGSEVALQQPFTDEFAAFDVDRGRWRPLPSTGGGRDMTGPLMATASGLVRTVGNLDKVTSVYLLRPGAKKWRRLPDLPPQLQRTVSAGTFILAGGLKPGSNDHDRGRYLLPHGRWEPLPPAPVWTAGGASVADGGLVALWYGSATERPERPNGALLRPRSDLWESIPPPPERVHGGLLVPGGRDFFLVVSQPDPPSNHPRLVARFHPGSTPQPGLQTLPTPSVAGVCRASSVTATAGENEFTRGERYTIVFTNPTAEVCSLGGPIQLTATDGGDPPTTFVDERSAQVGPTILALPDVEWAAKVTLNVHSGVPGSGPPRPLPECAARPVAAHIFLSWPGSDGRLEVHGPPVGRTRLCHAEVSPFIDPWPFW